MFGNILKLQEQVPSETFSHKKSILAIDPHEKHMLTAHLQM